MKKASLDNPTFKQGDIILVDDAPHLVLNVGEQFYNLGNLVRQPYNDEDVDIELIDQSAHKVNDLSNLSMAAQKGLQAFEIYKGKIWEERYKDNVPLAEEPYDKSELGIGATKKKADQEFNMDEWEFELPTVSTKGWTEEDWKFWVTQHGKKKIKTATVNKEEAYVTSRPAEEYAVTVHPSSPEEGKKIRELFKKVFKSEFVDDKDWIFDVRVPARSEEEAKKFMQSVLDGGDIKTEFRKIPASLNKKAGETDLIDQIIDDVFQHEQPACDYGHQLSAKKMTQELLDHARRDKTLTTQIEALGNEFNLRQYVESYLDEHCEFNEVQAALNPTAGSLNKKLKELNKQMEAATDPAEIESYLNAIKSLKEHIKETTEEKEQKKKEKEENQVSTEVAAPLNTEADNSQIEEMDAKLDELHELLRQETRSMADKAIIQEEIKMLEDKKEQALLNVKATGEQGPRDIQEGGEDFEWAQAIENEVKNIESMTDGKLKFGQMRPFDKYQGPYAEVTINGKPDKIWDAQSGPGSTDLWIEKLKWMGDASLLAAAIEGDQTAMEQVKNLGTNASLKSKASKVVLDVVDLEDQAFQDWLKMSGIKYKVLRQHGPGGGWPEVEFTGPKVELEKMVMIHFGDADLMEHIEASMNKKAEEPMKEKPVEYKELKIRPKDVDPEDVQKALLPTDEILDTYNKLKKTQNNLAGIARTAQEIKEKLEEEIRKADKEGKKAENEAELRNLVDSLFDLISASQSKVVAFGSKLVAIVEETKEVPYKLSDKEKLERILDKFPDVEKYVKKLEAGIQNMASSAKIKKLIEFEQKEHAAKPAPKSSLQLSRIDKEATVMDAFKNIYDMAKNFFTDLSTMSEELDALFPSEPEMEPVAASLKHASLDDVKNYVLQTQFGDDEDIENEVKNAQNIDDIKDSLFQHGLDVGDWITMLEDILIRKASLNKKAEEPKAPVEEEKTKEVSIEDLQKEMDWSELESEVSKRIGEKVQFDVSIVPGRHKSRFELKNKKNLADKAGVLSFLFKELHVSSFNSEQTDTGYWMTISYRWQFKSGGSNGASFLDAVWDHEKKSWRFQERFN